MSKENDCAKRKKPHKLDVSGKRIVAFYHYAGNHHKRQGGGGKLITHKQHNKNYYTEEQKSRKLGARNGNNATDKHAKKHKRL